MSAALLRYFDLPRGCATNETNPDAKILNLLISAAPRAFTIFCEERRRPDVSPAVNLLARKPLRPGALDIFARRDPMGTGFVCRVDLFDGLRELGVSGTPPQQASNDRVPTLYACLL